MGRASSSTGIVLGACGLLLAALLPGSVRAVDLTIEAIEVTQAIQDSANTSALIAGRSTTFRVRVGMTGNLAAIPTVTGTLGVSVGGTTITPPGGVTPSNGGFRPPRPAEFDRSREDHTLNFEFSSPSGIGASSDVVVTARLTSTPPDANPGNNSKDVRLTFEKRLSPKIHFVPVAYGDGGGASVPPQGDAFLRGTFPLDDGDAAVYEPYPCLPSPPLRFYYDPDGDSTIDDMSEVWQLLGLLDYCRAWCGGDDRTFLYGWTGFPVEANGWSGHRVAFGNTDPERYQRTFAHEVGHMLGLDHNTRTLDEVGWDVKDRLALGKVKRRSLFDLMVAGKKTHQAWVDTITLAELARADVLTSGPGAGGPQSDRVVSLQGAMSDDGGKIVVRNPAFEFPRPVLPTRSFEKGRYVAELTDANGKVTSVKFDAVVHADAEGVKPRRGFFSVRIPADVPARMLRVRDTAGDAVMATWERSERAPSLTIRSPEAGAAIEGRFAVEWSAEDPDGKDLLFQVIYSPDGGKSFVPIGVDVRDSRLVVDAAALRGKETDDGLIRIYASSGLHTAVAEIRKLRLAGS